jgi:hypothetical protein
MAGWGKARGWGTERCDRSGENELSGDVGGHLLLLSGREFTPLGVSLGHLFGHAAGVAKPQAALQETVTFGLLIGGRLRNGHRSLQEH